MAHLERNWLVVAEQERASGVKALSIEYGKYHELR
jgi:hypothetical protein